MDDDNTMIKKAKGTKKCVIKRILKSNNYENCLLNNEVNHEVNKDLRMNYMMYILKKSTRFH